MFTGELTFIWHSGILSDTANKLVLVAIKEIDLTATVVDYCPMQNIMFTNC